MILAIYLGTYCGKCIHSLQCPLVLFSKAVPNPIFNPIDAGPRYALPFVNSVDPDLLAPEETSGLDLHCLFFCFLFFFVICLQSERCKN